jgi:hypothetical protein
MSARIVTDGDTVNFKFAETPLASNQFSPDPTQHEITGSGHATINGKKVCTAQDANTFVYTFTYITGAFTIPGNGTITITKASTAAYITSPDAADALLVDAPSFEALVQFQAPATNPATGMLDPNAVPTPVMGDFVKQMPNAVNDFVSAAE